MLAYWINSLGKLPTEIWAPLTLNYTFYSNYSANFRLILLFVDTKQAIIQIMGNNIASALELEDSTSLGRNVVFTFTQIYKDIIFYKTGTVIKTAAESPISLVMHFKWTNIRIIFVFWEAIGVHNVSRGGHCISSKCRHVLTTLHTPTLLIPPPWRLPI